jgi:hypothetical protein
MQSLERTRAFILGDVEFAAKEMNYDARCMGFQAPPGGLLFPFCARGRPSNE